MTRLGNDWETLLEADFQADYYVRLQRFLDEQYRHEVVYPERDELFTALRLTSYADTKVVILGQDPYHGPGQAHGLSFSVKPGAKIPPSLKNIYKELQDDLGCYIPNNGYLVKWAEQGVLLLNTVLTVRAGSPNSHKGIGWENLTDRIIQLVNRREKPAVFILWGNHAQEKRPLIDENRHCILSSAHPSPFSARKGFFGSKPFSAANHFLQKIGSTPIDWQIPHIENGL
ncbi:uracil-DNA glycosylase [Brevibacillus massiliensis]|jgi:uracil-DNA glycosylase|uniref:uracil-DNA glycosylase n=1 Tax=Brevibacillus massiliensis TaxID=1118054 RepID=UPI0002D852A4|nr:uracil-DNA glycosylase [Brevibacillus massiliensis]